MFKNTNNLYAIIGFLTGILLTIAFVFFYGFLGSDKTCCKAGMHKMSDGTMMKNVGMDMESMMHGMTSSLEGKTGEDFDKIFLSEMIVHHQGAVDMAELVLENSNKVELKKLAEDIIKAQNNEIKLMQDWEKAWFK